jgi:hypothetical protein
MKVSIYCDGDLEVMTVFDIDKWVKVDKSVLIGKTIKSIEFSNESQTTTLEVE